MNFGSCIGIFTACSGLRWTATKRFSSPLTSRRSSNTKRHQEGFKGSHALREHREIDGPPVRLPSTEGQTAVLTYGAIVWTRPEVTRTVEPPAALIAAK